VEFSSLSVFDEVGAVWAHCCRTQPRYALLPDDLSSNAAVMAASTSVDLDLSPTATQCELRALDDTVANKHSCCAVVAGRVGVVARSAGKCHDKSISLRKSGERIAGAIVLAEGSLTPRDSAA
jgi:hypothetical protein